MTPTMYAVLGALVVAVIGQGSYHLYMTCKESKRELDARHAKERQEFEAWRTDTRRVLAQVLAEDQAAEARARRGVDLPWTAWKQKKVRSSKQRKQKRKSRRSRSWS